MGRSRGSADRRRRSAFGPGPTSMVWHAERLCGRRPPQGYRTEKSFARHPCGRVPFERQIACRAGLAMPVELRVDEFDLDIVENRALPGGGTARPSAASITGRSRPEPDRAASHVPPLRRREPVPVAGNDGPPRAPGSRSVASTEEGEPPSPNTAPPTNSIGGARRERSASRRRRRRPPTAASARRRRASRRRRACRSGARARCSSSSSGAILARKARPERLWVRQTMPTRSPQVRSIATTWRASPRARRARRGGSRNTVVVSRRRSAMRRAIRSSVARSRSPTTGGQTIETCTSGSIVVAAQPSTARCLNARPTVGGSPAGVESELDAVVGGRADGGHAVGRAASPPRRRRPRRRRA